MIQRTPDSVGSTLHLGDVDDMAVLAELAVKRYGLGSVSTIDLYPLTENWTFRIECEVPEPVVLRVYRPGGRPKLEVSSELAWMEAIREHDPTLVPAVIPTPEGAEVLEITRDAPLPSCLCVLFEYAPGHEPAEDELAAWFPTLGEVTARLHRHARAWQPPPWFERPRWDVATTLGEAAHWGPWQRGVLAADEVDQLQRLADVVMARLARFGTSSPRFGLVHADLRLANLLVDQQRLTVIDFDDCGFSWFMYDLACALTFNEGHPDVDELIAAWVDGYRRVEPLASADEDEIPTFLMLRRLMLSAYVGLRPDTELARELHEGRFATESCALAERYLSRFA